MNKGFSYVIDHFTGGKKDINTSRTDKFSLSAALDMAYILILDKTRLCDLIINDVFDGQSIRSNIIRDTNEPPILIPNNLAQVIADYLKHRSALKNQLTISDSPLFPYYSGGNRPKNLLRHIKNFTSYHDYHELKKEAIKYRAVNIQQTDPQHKDLTGEVANNAGKTRRTIDTILKGKSSVPKRKNEGPAGRYMELADGIVVLPAAIALDEKKVIKMIEEAFACAKIFKRKPNCGDTESYLTEFNFVNNIGQRVQEIEQEIIEKREQATQDLSTDLGRKRPYNYMDLMREAAEHPQQINSSRQDLFYKEYSGEHAEIIDNPEKSYEVLGNFNAATNESMGVSPESADGSPNNAIKDMNQQPEHGNDTILTAIISKKISLDELNNKISEVMADVDRVRAMIPGDEWTQVKKALKRKPHLKKKRTQKEKKNTHERESNFYPRLSKKEIKERRVKEYLQSLREKEAEHTIVVIRNATNIMRECGLLPSKPAELANVKKIAGLKVCEVIKPEHLHDFQISETISPDWIVSEVNSLFLPPSARAVMAQHLDFMKKIFHDLRYPIDPTRIIFFKPPKLLYRQKHASKEDEQKRQAPPKATRKTFGYFTAAALTSRINNMSQHVL